jgi:hypothetical protein
MESVIMPTLGVLLLWAAAVSVLRQRIRASQSAAVRDCHVVSARLILLQPLTLVLQRAAGKTLKTLVVVISLLLL